MANKHQKNKEKTHVKDIKIRKEDSEKISEKEKKGEKRPKEYIKIFLRNKSISYLSI